MNIWLGGGRSREAGISTLGACSGGAFSSSAAGWNIMLARGSALAVVWRSGRALIVSSCGA